MNGITYDSFVTGMQALQNPVTNNYINYAIKDLSQRINELYKYDCSNNDTDLITLFRALVNYQDDMDEDNFKLLKERKEFSMDELENNYKSLRTSIELTRHKQVFNWYDIYPIPYNNFQTSQVYLDTSDNFYYNTNIDISSNKGLTYIDFFNVFYKILYKQMYDSGVKWFLYEKYVNGAFVHFYEQVDKIIDDYNTHGHVLWNQLNRDFIKCLKLKFDIQYAHKVYLNVDDDYIAESKRYLNTINADYEKINYTAIDIFTATFNDFSSRHKDIYDYLVDRREKFRKTFYGLYIQDNNDYLNILNNNITLKNLYNLAKSISLYIIENNKFDGDGKGLNDDMKGRLKLDDWRFGIRIVLSNVYNTNDVNLLQRIQRNILLQILSKDGKDSNGNDIDITQNQDVILPLIFDNSRIKDLVFFVLTRLGMITHRIDPRHKPNGNGDMMVNYLTRETFDSYDPPNDKQHPWRNEDKLKFFALELVPQLTFMAHYLYNRVLLLTGGTGEGKSVVMPILFLHASINIDIIYETKIIVTQVLTAATISNAERIGDSVGAPIYYEDDEQYKNTYHIQYSTQGQKHMTHGQQTYLKQVTVETLLNEMISSFANNKYNIIMVDESHMHTASIDMILSLLKPLLMYDNRLRLVIVSATMNADVDNYLNFYEPIDDSLIFPITSYNKHTPYRRFHIERPGKKLYKKYAQFLPETNPISKPKYEEVMKASVNKTIDLANDNSKEGHILLFVTKTKETEDLTVEINSRTNDNVMAFPLNAALRKIGSGEWFKLITEMDTNISKINYDKKDIITKIKSDAQIGNDVVNRYTKAVIIATNVVEASVTINGLKYVVDSGYENFVSLNMGTFSDKNEYVFITESSMMQRRGRVGRTSDGYIYHMYPKSALVKTKLKGIETEDITFKIYDLLTSDETVGAAFSLADHPQITGRNPQINNKIRYFNAESVDIKLVQESDFIVPTKNGYTKEQLCDKNNKLYLYHPSIIRINLAYKFIKCLRFDLITDLVKECQKQDPSLLQLFKDLSRIIKALFLAQKYNISDDVIKILSLAYALSSNSYLYAKFQQKPQYRHVSECELYLEIMNIVVINPTTFASINTLTNIYNLNNTTITNAILNYKKLQHLNDIVIKNKTLVPNYPSIPITKVPYLTILCDSYAYNMAIMSSNFKELTLKASGEQIDIDTNSQFMRIIPDTNYFFIRASSEVSDEPINHDIYKVIGLTMISKSLVEKIIFPDCNE